MASRTCARRPYFSPIGFNPQMKGAERLRDSVARRAWRPPSAAFIGADQPMASAKAISPPRKADVPYRNPLTSLSLDPVGTARALAGEGPVERAPLSTLPNRRGCGPRGEGSFLQRIELIDRLAGGLRKIAEIKIGCDLVAHISLGEAELGSFLGNGNRGRYVDPVLQRGVFERLDDHVLADARELDDDLDGFVPVLSVIILRLHISPEEIHGGLAVLQKFRVCGEQLIATIEGRGRGNIATRWIVGITLDHAAIDGRREHHKPVEIAIPKRLQLCCARRGHIDQIDLGNVDVVGLGRQNEQYLRKCPRCAADLLAFQVLPGFEVYALAHDQVLSA